MSCNRPLKELELQPCRFMIKQMGPRPVIKKIQSNRITEPSDTPGKIRVRKTIQKTDENGQLLYEIKKVEIKKGCKCKGNQQTVIEERKVPITVDIWVEEDAPVEPVAEIVETTMEKYAICKMFGQVPFSYCQKCSTYQK